MSEPMLGVVMLCLLCIAIMIGFPTAFTLMALGVFFGYLGRRPRLPVAGPARLRRHDQRRPDRRPAVRLHGVHHRAGRTLDCSQHPDRARPIRGSILLATLATCTVFATATGIVGASVTLIGLLALPAMIRAKYDIQLSTGTSPLAARSGS